MLRRTPPFDLAATEPGSLLPRGGSVLDSPAPAPARGAGKSPFATAGPTKPERFAVAAEARGPAAARPLRFPPPAAFTQGRANSASA